MILFIMNYFLSFIFSFHLLERINEFPLSLSFQTQDHLTMIFWLTIGKLIPISLFALAYKSRTKEFGSGRIFRWLFFILLTDGVTITAAHRLQLIQLASFGLNVVSVFIFLLAFGLLSLTTYLAYQELKLTEGKSKRFFIWFAFKWGLVYVATYWTARTFPQLFFASQTKLNGLIRWTGLCFSLTFFATASLTWIFKWWKRPLSPDQTVSVLSLFFVLLNGFFISCLPMIEFNLSELILFYLTMLILHTFFFFLQTMMKSLMDWISEYENRLAVLSFIVSLFNCGLTHYIMSQWIQIGYEREFLFTTTIQVYQRNFLFIAFSLCYPLFISPIVWRLSHVKLSGHQELGLSSDIFGAIVKSLILVGLLMFAHLEVQTLSLQELLIGMGLFLVSFECLIWIQSKCYYLIRRMIQKKR